jgi:hypothetical protein
MEALIMKIIRTANFKRKTYSNPDNPPAIRKIFAAGLGRVVQHMISDGQWGIVSAHSTPLNKDVQMSGQGTTHPENKQRGAELKDFLREKGIGFIQMSGAWVDEEVEKFIKEESLLLPNVDDAFVQAIAQKYNQDSYIFGQNGKFFLKNTETGNIEKGGNVKDHFRQFSGVDTPAFGYSETNGRQWILDKKLPSRSNQVVEEIKEPEQNEQNEQAIFSKSKLKLRLAKVAKSPDALIVWTKRPKYLGWEGIMKDDDETPPGSSLLAFLPLMLK